MNIKDYTLTLTTLTNLHIGSGETTQTFEYFYDNNTKSFTFVSEELLIKEILDNNLEDKFSKLLSSSSSSVSSNRSRDLKTIISFLFDNFNYNKITKYIIKGAPKIYNKMPRMSPIERFIRNGNDEIYIPGSSIKGFITSILNLSKEDEIRSEISISDSKSISNDHLWISTISYFNRLYDENNTKEHNLPKDGQSNYVEFIKPGTKIVFKLRMPSHLLDVFEKNLIKFNENYSKLYENYFDSKVKSNHYNSLSNNRVFRIGKYTNFLLKTQHIIENNKDYEDLFKRIKDYRKFPRKIERKLFQISDENQMYPLNLKLSVTEDLKYQENGICSYELKESLWECY